MSHTREVIARALSLVQAFVWAGLLMHGGWGLFFAPLAVLAAALGGRYPAVGPLLLAPPVVWLTLSWAGTLADASRVGDWAVWSILVAPGAGAAVLFTVATVQRSRRAVAVSTRKGRTGSR